MRKLLNNEKGLTLVEVLAVFVIGVIVMILMIGVITSMQKQYNDQSSQSLNLFDSTYAVKMITKDVRVANSVFISCNENTLEIISQRDGKEVKMAYNFSGSKIIRKTTENGKESISSIKNIEKFRVSLPDNNAPDNKQCPDKDGNGLLKVEQFDLEIRSSSNKHLKTTITIRSGDSDEDSNTK